MSESRYHILRVDGYEINPGTTVGATGYPGASFTVCDLADAARELAHFEAAGSKSRKIRDANVRGAAYEAKLFVNRLRYRDRIEAAA